VKREVDDYKNSLAAAGEKLTVSELRPPRLVPELNSQESFVRGVSLLDVGTGVLWTNAPAGMRLAAPGKAIIASARPDVRNTSVNSWADIEAVLARDAEGLKALRQVADRPVLDFHLNYDLGLDKLPFSQFPKLREGANALSADALCSLHRGDIAQAVADTRAVLALAKGTEQEKLAITQLVRMALAGTACADTWEILQSPGVTGEQLKLLQGDWTSLDFLHAAEQSLAMERALGQASLARWRSSDEELWRNFGLANAADKSSNRWVRLSDRSWRATKGKSSEWLWKYSWSYSDELEALKGYQVLIESFRMVETNCPFKTAIQNQDSRLAELGFDSLTNSYGSLGLPELSDMPTLFSESVNALRGVLTRVQRAEATRQLVIAAIALKRGALQTGAYPAELPALVPAYLAAAPRDPVDGKPLRYQRIGNGSFLLYSIGEDGKDNGGDPSPPAKSAGPGGWLDGYSHDTGSWLNGHDWVWPWPASENEIREYELDRAYRK
jgi:hypothetical protein